MLRRRLSGWVVGCPLGTGAGLSSGKGGVVGLSMGEVEGRGGVIGLLTEEVEGNGGVMGLSVKVEGKGGVIGLSVGEVDTERSAKVGTGSISSCTSPN
jgi:hypothetical protein